MAMKKLMITTLLSVFASSSAIAQELVLLTDVNLSADKDSAAIFQDAGSDCRYLGSVGAQKIVLLREVCIGKNNQPIEREIRFEFETEKYPLRAGERFILDIQG